MTEKTKKKIEAMVNSGLDPKQLPNIDYKIGFERGATPWAEWCERFIEKISEGDLYNANVLVRDFMEWLEEQ